MSTAEVGDPIAERSLRTDEVRHGSFSEVFSDALRGVPVVVRGISAADQVMPMADWLRPASRSDRVFLDHCRGATLDVGCGPGRMSAHLALHGHFVLGIDVVAEAVDQTRRRGVPALRRDVFDPLPGEGHWDTVLLADGNIGIGGAPQALLGRVAELLEPGGRVVCDLDEPGTGLRVHTARLVSQRRRSAAFAWARVGPDAIGPLAIDAGLRVEHVGENHGRWAAVLTR